MNQYRRLADSGMRTVWVMPKALMAKNKQELMRFTPLQDRDIAILDGTRAKISRLMSHDPGVVIMGPDRFKSLMPDLRGVYAANDVDEFHMCFGGAGGRSDGFGGTLPSARVEAFYDFQQYTKESVFMTGTLINGRLDTAYPAIHAIEPNYYPFGYDQFVASHAIVDDYGRPQSWMGHDRLREILKRHSIRFTFEQVFGKQEIVFELEWLAMSSAQRKIYDQFEKEALVELENFIIDGTMPGVATIRARQIMEHPNAFPDLRDPDHELKLPPVDIMPGQLPGKAEALKIHFDHHYRRGTPVIVFASLKPQMRQIADLAREVGLRVAPIMNGDATARQKVEADEGFREGRYDCLVGSPPVCGVGFNWQFWGAMMMEVDHVIFSSLTYLPNDFIQAYRRAVRQNRIKPLRVTTQAYLDSLDIPIMGINKRKSRDANKVDPTQEVICFSSHDND